MVVKYVIGAALGATAVYFLTRNRASPTETTARITGKVLGTVGIVPRVGATVTFITDEETFETVTDAAGTYNIEIPAGVRVQATVAGDGILFPQSFNFSPFPGGDIALGFRA